MRRRGRAVFAAFDLLWLNGRDVRELTLTKRKTLLRAIVPERSPSILYVQHVKRDGRALFNAVCQHDLEDRREARARALRRDGADVDQDQEPELLAA
jgi:bifunctional non-homologous end joining protein LigD